MILRANMVYEFDLAAYTKFFHMALEPGEGG